MAWAQKRAQVRSQVRPMVGRRDGAAAPNGALVDRAGNYILDRSGNYIVAVTAPRTS